ncbi:MAG TPA: ABC transporter ATP-binding protein [Anaerolineaceae bacterium]|nr:ABC transporter ATP-binding protein [Anaerolineaceae bacterium]
MFQIVRKHWRVLMLCVLVSIVTAISAVAVQFVKGKLLDQALARSTTLAWRNGLLLFLLISAEIGGYYAYNRLRGKFVALSLETLRSRWMASILCRSVPEFNKHPQGSYLSTYTNKVESLKMLFFYNIPSIFEIAFKALLVSFSLLRLDYRIALMTLVLATTPLYVPKLVEKKLQQSQEESVRTYEHHLTKVVEWLNGFEVIRNHSVEKIVQKKFDLLGDSVTHAHLQNQKMMFLSQMLSTSLSYFSHFIVLAVAAWLVLRGEFTAGQFFIAISMIDQLSWPILGLSRMTQDFVSAKPIRDEVERFLNYAPPSAVKPQRVSEGKPNIHFDQVSFAFNGEKPLIEGLSLNIPAGSKVLMLGPSGSGKSTAVNLMLGYLEPQNGRVELENIPASQVSNMYELVTILRQEVFLFQGTLRENLSLYQPVSDDDMMKALCRVGLSAWADQARLSLPIEEGGKNLSGGEKRRIALARSLLRQSPVLILDEPLANLDVESIKRVEQVIKEISDRTVIFISHQISPQLKACFDQVVQF